MLPFEPDLDHTMGGQWLVVYTNSTQPGHLGICAQDMRFPANWEMRPHCHVSCMHEGKHAFLRLRVAKAHWGLRTL